MSIKTVYEDCDILVVGGGMGGTGAAYEARYWGRDLKIVVAEKANIDRSGAVAQGLYAINCYMGTQWGENNPEDHVRYARNDLMGLIHHSDHGVQYTTWLYGDRLQAVGICPSMGEVGNCYENALAERMNGILKCEYGLNDLFIDKAHAFTAVRDAVWLYNYERPHLSLDYCKPADIHFSI